MKRNTLNAFLSLLLAAALLLALLPSCAVAASGYDLYVGGEKVTDKLLSGDGWTFEPSSFTLTLSGYQYSGPGRKNKSVYSAVSYEGKKTLRIVLEGENRIFVDNDDENGGLIRSISSSGKLEIGGDGSLEVTAGSCSEFSCAIWSHGDLAFTGGTVTAVSGKAKNGFAIQSEGGFTFSGGELNASCEEVSGYTAAINVLGDLTVHDGIIRATAGNAVRSKNDNNTKGLGSCAMNVQGKIVFNGGEVTLLGGETVRLRGLKGYSEGLYAMKGAEVNGGEISITAGASNHESLAVYGTITINGGTVTITGGQIVGPKVGEKESDFGSYGVEGKVIIGEGKAAVTICGDDAAVLGTVKTARTGTGWTDTAGTEGKDTIKADKKKEQNLKFKRIRFSAGFSFSTGK